MRRDQAEFLRHQIYDDGCGVMYDILRLVLWAEKNCVVEELHVDALMPSFETGSSEEFDDSPEFIERALMAEDYPLLVFADRHDFDYEIVDGRHRFWKALFLGKTHVRCYVINENTLPGSVIHIPADDEIEVT